VRGGRVLVRVRGVRQRLREEVEQVGCRGDAEPRGERADRVRRGQARQRRNASVAFVPPNPKPFDSAAWTSTFRAAFGT
jgi:hypothetical protein